ncbi:hypothetical protein NLI96_g9521 [Meripilus lineatus]|uniref:RING-type domain-containing protein n=1 Tax=Meripilus lineatus TaxID=2056292 RepID=A0AAD5UWV7_9APHY|nr:hypothetical protein NLI96_g9521 [Physisporinus lineatus]
MGAPCMMIVELPQILLHFFSHPNALILSASSNNSQLSKMDKPSKFHPYTGPRYPLPNHKSRLETSSGDRHSAKRTQEKLQSPLAAADSTDTIEKRLERLKDREKALEMLERSLSAKAEELQEREHYIECMEEEIKQKIKNISHCESAMIDDAKKTIKFLQDTFACSICHDVMAYPVTVANSNCGHSFCALCLLKGFFSLLDEDGYWSAQLACPTCRTALALIPDDTPRPAHTCPFIPNTATDKEITQLVDSLHQYTFDVPGPAEEILTWLINGGSRVKWWIRARYGKFVADSVIKDWAQCQRHEFLCMAKLVNVMKY